MKKFIVGALAIIGALSILCVVVGGAIILLTMLARPGVPAKTILELNLEVGLLEDAPDDPIAQMVSRTTPVLRDIVDALDKAGDDPKVVGLVARVGAAPMGLSQVQEIRDAVARFRAKNKFAVAYSETFGEVGPGNGAYYLATAFDEIWLQPSGDIGLNGLVSESPFLKGTLEKLGVKAQMDHRHEYKNAKNLFTEDRFTPPHKEALEGIIKSMFNQMVSGIADRRGISEDQVRSLIDAGPIIGAESLDLGLVDGLAYRDEVYAKVKERAGDGARLLYLSKYLSRAGRPHASGETIALIYGVGAVVRGNSGFDPVFGDVTMGSDTVAAAFRAAIEDRSVKAIVFRINSPGGSYVASDAIWRETIRAREAGKPVIATMGDVAGSGGYFVAMSADKIVAQPATITGSIGVLGGKMVTTGFWDKIGISWDEVHEGKNATMFSSIREYTPDEWARFQAWLDRVYDDFTAKVAEGRKLPREQVLEVAKGRIWSGQDAKDVGLVDELGGFETALRLAKEAAGIDQAASVRLKVFPAKKTAFQAYFGEGPDSSEREGAEVMAARILELVRPLARSLRMIDREDNVLAMPEFRIRN